MYEYRNKVAVAGVGYSEVGRRLPRTLASLTVEACDNALVDAGVGREVVDGVGSYPDMPRYGGAQGTVEGIDVVSPHHLPQLLGIERQVRWVSSTHGMVTQSFIDAVLAIHSGECQYALVYRALHVPEGSYVNFEGTGAYGPEQFTAPYGFTVPPAWAAIVLRRYLDVYGYTREDLAPYIVENRRNAQLNPNSYWRGKTLTAEDYLDGRMIADPMTVLDCDIPIDGACALLLTSTERARDLRQKPALVTGFSASLHEGPSGLVQNLEDIIEGSRQVGEQLWRSSGVGPGDIDNVQLYDGFSPFVYTWLEALEFTKPGEAVAFARDGHTSLTGSLPTNTGGGALGEGRLHGMTHLAEAVQQVTDRAGERQVPGASVSLATVSNGLAKATGFVFTRDA